LGITKHSKSYNYIVRQDIYVYTRIVVVTIKTSIINRSKHFGKDCVWYTSVCCVYIKLNQEHLRC